MITLEEAYERLPIEVYKNFEKFYYIFLQEDYLSPQWYTMREMMHKILVEHKIEDNNPFDFE